MAQCGTRHKEGAPLGQGLCSVPMWCLGCPADFCNEPAYGPQQRLKRGVFVGTTCSPKQHRFPSCSGLACPTHGGPTLQKVIKDRVVIRFDGPPAPEAGRFIEVERNGASIKFGEWVNDGDDWLLVLPGEVKENNDDQA